MVKIENEKISEICCELNSVYWRCHNKLRYEEYVNWLDICRCLTIATNKMRELTDSLPTSELKGTLVHLLTYVAPENQPKSDTSGKDWISFMYETSNIFYITLKKFCK